MTRHSTEAALPFDQEHWRVHQDPNSTIQIINQQGIVVATVSSATPEALAAIIALPPMVRALRLAGGQLDAILNSSAPLDSEALDTVLQSVNTAIPR